MPIGQFFAACRLVIVAGKGGVGKTTVTATLARAAADAGLNALICEVEGKSGLASMFHAEGFGYDEVILASGLGPGATGVVRARALTPDRALVEYLSEHGMRRISNRLSRSGVLDVVAAAAPGIDDILVLGKVKQLERLAAADVVLLDAPAAGHAITFLRAARSLLDTVRVGPIRDQAREVLELLTDATRSQVMLVTLAEETPVNELIDTAYALEDSVGVKLGPVVVNSVLLEVEGLELVDDASGPLADAAAFRRGRMNLQREQIARLADSLPLPQVHLPQLFTAAIGPEELGTLANAFAERVHA